MATPTLNQIIDAYINNAGYAANDSLTEARAFETACRQYLIYPQRSEDGGAAMRKSEQFDMQTLKSELESVKKWIAAKGPQSASGTEYSDPNTFDVHFGLTDGRC